MPLIDQKLAGSKALSAAIVLNELCGLITTLLPTDPYFTDHYQTVLDELINACQWKQLLAKSAFDELLSNPQSLVWQADFRRDLEKQQKSQEATQFRRLTRCLTNDDLQPVAYRTLRMFVRFLQKSDPSNWQQTNLFWLRDNRVQLRLPLTIFYLQAQTAFYAFLFRAPEEADFLKEALLKTKSWLIREVSEPMRPPGPELIKDIEDLVGKVSEKFLTKCHQIRNGSITFYLDVRLSTYLISFVKKPSVLKKLKAGRQQEIRLDELPEQGENACYMDETDDGWDTYRLLVRRCLPSIEEHCQLIINKRFGFDTEDQATVILKELATLFSMLESALESKYYRCLKNLKSCIIAASDQHRLNTLPR